MGAASSRDEEGSESQTIEDNTDGKLIIINGPGSDETGKDVTEKIKKKVLEDYEDIIKDADSSIDMSSEEKIYDQLVNGVFLNQKQKKYWVDKETNANCFMLYPRALSITWADDERYWSWIPVKDSSSDESTEAAEMNEVCWLEVTGNFPTKNLTPDTTYEVVFVVKLIDPAFGWDVPVSFQLVLPNGEKQEREEVMMMKLRHRWLEIPAGEFRVSPENSGECQFSMVEYMGGKWKKGLVIKGVEIRPKS